MVVVVSYRQENELWVPLQAMIFFLLGKVVSATKPMLCFMELVNFQEKKIQQF
jgi:hypothetical protein